MNVIEQFVFFRDAIAFDRRIKNDSNTQRFEMNKNLLTNQNFLGQIGQLGSKGHQKPVLSLRHAHKKQA